MLNGVDMTCCSANTKSRHNHHNKWWLLTWWQHDHGVDAWVLEGRRRQDQLPESFFLLSRFFYWAFFIEPVFFIELERGGVDKTNCLRGGKVIFCHHQLFHHFFFTRGSWSSLASFGITFHLAILIKKDKISMFFWSVAAWHHTSPIDLNLKKKTESL